MTRIKRGITTHARHHKILKAAKGYRGRRHKTYRTAVQAVEKGLQYAYRDRRVKKRQFRALWIQRINAATRQYNITYSQLINGLKKEGIQLNRKMLASLAVSNSDEFKSLVTKTVNISI